MVEMHLVAENQLTLLQSGAEYFPQLCADMDAAQRFIYVETYLFVRDETGLRVVEALHRAARRGVEVQLLMDGFGSAEFPLEWLAELTESGVQVQWFRREIYRFRMRRHRLRRLHRKLVVIDGEVAFVGGINIIDDATNNGHAGAGRLDFAVRVQGHAAAEVQVAMRRLWSAVSWASLRIRGKRIARFFPVSEAKSTKIRLLLRDNLRHRRDIERAYLHAIKSAKSEVLIANAYFLPGRAFRRALKQAVRRGVRVVLLLQGKVEYRLQHYATHALYEQLLSVGVEIYEYQAGYLHAKVAVVDSNWATVGSSNIDPFSLLLAREANLAISDSGFAIELRGKLFQAMADQAVRIDLTSWRKSSFLARMARHLSYGVVRLLLGVLNRQKY